MRNRLLALAVTIVVAGVPGATSAFAQTAAPTRRPDVIYVPTPEPVVEAMLQVANVTKNDVVYDLGCGDGRIPVTAAQQVRRARRVLRHRSRAHQGSERERGEEQRRQPRAGSCTPICSSRISAARR